MSCHNWESGSVKVPTAEWGKMKKAFRQRFNSSYETLFTKAVTIYNRLKMESKGKRNFNFKDRLYQLMGSQNISDGNWACVGDSMFPFRKGNDRPFKPQKKAFPVARNNLDYYQEDELTVSFNNKTKTVHYTTDENNHAVDRCEGSILGIAVLQALQQTVFGRGSGGKFIGNDEYNTECSSEGGGANYVTRRFGPLGHK